MKKTINILLGFTLLATLPQPAFAYLDPGAGSFMLQMLIAGIMGAMFTIKLYWYRLKSFIGSLMGKTIENPMEDDLGDDEDQNQKQKESDETSK